MDWTSCKTPPRSMAITARCGAIFTSLLPSEGIMVEVCSLEEVTYWAKKGHLGSDSDPTESGVANLIMAVQY